MIGKPMLGQEIITNSGTKLIVKPRALMQIDYWVWGLARGGQLKDEKP
jgi:hypothetical protein